VIRSLPTEVDTVFALVFFDYAAPIKSSATPILKISSSIVGPDGSIIHSAWVGFWGGAFRRRAAHFLALGNLLLLTSALLFTYWTDGAKMRSVHVSPWGGSVPPEQGRPTCSLTGQPQNPFVASAA
jgi:hypothetical protein